MYLCNAAHSIVTVPSQANVSFSNQFRLHCQSIWKLLCIKWMATWFFLSFLPSSHPRSRSRFLYPSFLITISIFILFTCALHFRLEIHACPISTRIPSSLYFIDKDKFYLTERTTTKIKRYIVHVNSDDAFIVRSHTIKCKMHHKWVRDS